VRFLKLVSSVFFLGITMLSVQTAAQTALKNAELLEKSGLAHSISGIPDAMLGVAERAPQMNPNLDPKFLQAWRTTAPIAYNADKILRIIDEGLERELTADDKRDLIAYYNSPLGKRTTELENAATNAEAQVQEYAKNPENFADRLPLYKELDTESGASEINATIFENMGVALQVGIFSAMNASFDLKALKAEASNAHAGLMKQAEQIVLPTFAFTYRSLSADEVKSYITFLRTPAAKKFYKASGKLLNDALTIQANELGQLVIKNLQSGSPT
jgi:hypothetical protein